MYIQNKPFNTTKNLGWRDFLAHRQPQRIRNASSQRDDLLMPPLLSDSSTIFMLPPNNQKLTQRKKV